MNREEKLQLMMSNYIQRKNLAVGIHVMEFHRKHLLLFLNRFRQLAARFATPSSSLLSHEIFLAVEAATIVARSDWEKLEEDDAARYYSFSQYFTAFDELKKGIVPLNATAALCAELLAT